MKKATLTLFTLLMLSTSLWAQQPQETFRIDFRAIPDANASTVERLSNPLFTTWVNDAYFKIDITKFEGLIYIVDKAENLSFALLPEMESYAVLADVDDDEISPVELILDNSQQKNVAGYNCKLAKIVIDYDAEDDEQSILEIWYSTEIPAFYWGEFPFFKQLNGAVLSLNVEGNGFEAVAIEKETVSTDFFAIPENYSMYEEDNEYENETSSLSEDRVSYRDEDSDLLGIKDTAGNIITAPLFYYISYFSQDNIAIATNSEGKFQAIDKNGNSLLPTTYDYLAYDHSSQEYLFGQDEKYGLLKKDGTISIPATYELLSFFNDGYAIFTQADKSGLINRNQKVIVPAVHEVLIDYNKTNFVVLEGEVYLLYSIADHKKILGSFDYLALPTVDSDLSLALKNGKYGYIDNKGKTVIPFKFSFASLFQDGLATVTEDEELLESYQINAKGERVETEEQ